MSFKENSHYLRYIICLAIVCMALALMPETIIAAADGPSTGETSSAYIYVDEEMVWSRDSGYAEKKIDGITYDLTTNTITMNGFSGGAVTANEMGDDLKLVLIGANKCEQLHVYGFGYGGSITISGTGSLEATGSDELLGICLDSEGAASVLKIMNGVSITTNALYVRASQTKNSIILDDGVSIAEGGKIAVSDPNEQGVFKVAVDENGNMVFTSEYTKNDKKYYISSTENHLNGLYLGISYCVYTISGDEATLVEEPKDISAYTKTVSYIYDACISKTGTFDSMNIETENKIIISSGEIKATKPARPVITVKATTTGIKISISATEGAEGYRIYMSKKSGSGYKSIKTKATSGKYSYTKKGLTEDTTYYFKVRAYKVVNGKKLWSSYSKVRSAKME